MSKTEGNKLIAEFMGLIPVDNGDDLTWFQVDEELYLTKDFRYKNDIQYTTSDMLPYHVSWDWLMPVVEKMWNITGHHNLLYQDVGEKLTFFAADGKLLIDRVYGLVIKFIKWYNKQKS